MPMTITPGLLAILRERGKIPPRALRVLAAAK